ncbi:CAP domain-containing protein, partial [Enterococcus faecalis]|uniref:CAP domain-containing protein n=1 Tax=Enterococcus faecalis TaxID=1351 RepID=UPI0027E0CA8C
ASSSTTEAQAPATSSSATESSTQQTTETTTPSTDNSATENTGSSSEQSTTPSGSESNGEGTVTPPTPEPDKKDPIPTPPPATGDVTLDALNVLRQSLGLRPVVWDAGLAASATARAAQVEAGGIPNDHWSRGDEVIAIMWAPGNSVIMAWYNETNMVTASGSGHRDWEINPGITRVGFGYSGSTIVGHSA